MTIYAVALSKGGSAKTATAAEVVAALARHGRRVLAIDLDEQGNLTKRLGITDDTETGGDAFDVLTAAATAAEAAVAAPAVPGAWVIVGTHALADAAQRPEIVTSLRDYLPHIAGEWDDIVIDTPPAIGLVTLAALAAADVVVAAVACKTETYDQLARLTSVLERRIAPRMHPGQKVHWIVPTIYDGRRRLDREVLEILTDEYPSRVTHTVREAVAVADAYTAGMPVSMYDPAAPVSQDYADALTPVIQTSLTSTTRDTAKTNSNRNGAAAHE